VRPGRPRVAVTDSGTHVRPAGARFRAWYRSHKPVPRAAPREPCAWLYQAPLALHGTTVLPLKLARMALRAFAAEGSGAVFKSLWR
jgi:hypothetical protein